MAITLCADCGGISMPYQGHKIEVCSKCAKERISKYFRKRG